MNANPSLGAPASSVDAPIPLAGWAGLAALPVGALCSRPMQLARGTATSLSDDARIRMLGMGAEPFLLADWHDVLMIHYDVAPEILQPFVPYPLDIRDGRAHVTLVAFTMNRMRPRRGGKVGALLLRPIAFSRFLNVRTYVKVGHETGIHFIAEYIDSAISVPLGRLLFALPYRLSTIVYDHDRKTGKLTGSVRERSSEVALRYTASLPKGCEFNASLADSFTEWLMERYTAFTGSGSDRRLFRVWHPPWPQTAVDVAVVDDSLLRVKHPWFAQAKKIGANFSPGWDDVGMSRPRNL